MGIKMISLNDYKNSKSVKGLVQKMFEARQVTHVHHLQTKSYSQHKALNGFYDDILELADAFVETYQGQYGILNGYGDVSMSDVDIEDYLQDCAKIFVIGRDSINEKDTHLKNIMDEVVALTYRTIYKIKNLK